MSYRMCLRSLLPMYSFTEFYSERYVTSYLNKLHLLFLRIFNV